MMTIINIWAGKRMNCNRTLAEQNQQNKTFHKLITPNVTKWIQ